MPSIMRWRSGLIGFSLIGVLLILRLTTPRSSPHPAPPTPPSRLSLSLRRRAGLSREAGSFSGTNLPFRGYASNGCYPANCRHEPVAETPIGNGQGWPNRTGRFRASGARSCHSFNRRGTPELTVASHAVLAIILEGGRKKIIADRAASASSSKTSPTAPEPVRILCVQPTTRSCGDSNLAAAPMRPTLHRGRLSPNAPSVIQANEAFVELSRLIGRGSGRRSYFLNIMPPSICNTWPVVYVLVIRKM
jgi:hypothetical protein